MSSWSSEKARGKAARARARGCVVVIRRVPARLKACNPRPAFNLDKDTGSVPWPSLVPRQEKKQ